jgi:hypothetical protein
MTGAGPPEEKRDRLVSAEQHSQLAAPGPQIGPALEARHGSITERPAGSPDATGADACTYSLTIEDHIAFNQDIHFRGFWPRGIHLYDWLVIYAMFMTALVGLDVAGWLRSRLWLYAVSELQIDLVLCIFGLGLLFIFWHVNRTQIIPDEVRKKIGGAQLRRMLRPRTLAIGPDGVLATLGGSWDRNRWEGIYAVENTGQRLYLFVAPGVAYIVPRSAFTSEEAFEGFACRARDYHRAGSQGWIATPLPPDVPSVTVRISRQESARRSRAAASRGKNFLLGAVGFIVLAAGGLGWAVSFLRDGLAAPLLATGLMLFGGISLFLRVRLGRLLQKKGVQRCQGNLVDGETTWALTPAHLLNVDQYSEGAIAWESVRSVKVTEEGLTITALLPAGNFVPSSAFPDQASFLAFADTARRYHAAATAEPEDAEELVPPAAHPPSVHITPDRSGFRDKA